MSADACQLIEAPRRTLNISVHAYECLPGLVFVKVPNERGRWMLTHRCVAEVDCPHCHAIAGEPCKRRFSGGQIHYGVDTHAVRREAAKRTARRSQPKPKLRIRAEDILAAGAEAAEQSNG